MRETENSNTNWQLWCRLCAKDDPVSNVNVVFKDEQGDSGRSLSNTLYKYFGVQVDEALPKMLCTECFSFVTSLVNFAERVEKVQQMFQALTNNCDSQNTDCQAIRLQFGILENDREQIFVPQTSLLEVHYFDLKPKINDFEEKIFEDDVDADADNPLEQKARKSQAQKKRTNINVEEKTTGIKNRISKNDTDRDNNSDGLLDNESSTTETDLSYVDEEMSISSSNSKRYNNNKVKSKRKLRSHNVEKSAEEDDTITECNIFKNTHARKKRNIAKEQQYTCTECAQVFKRSQQYRQHMKRIHSLSVNFTDWKCTNCPDRVFLTQSQYEKHLKVHLPPELKKTVPCPCCNKKFSSNSIMQAHIKYIHNNDRPFICEECGITLRTNAALKAHMLTHTDFAPFECEVCKKGFKNHIRLKNHMETHDPHKHVCAKCGLQLNSRATLNRHLLVHSDVMSHKCDYCGRAFKRAKALKNHLLLHTGLKPYSCDFCERTFANGSNCRSHKKKAHPEELAALEASGGGKQYTRNIPKLEALKAVTKAADNLAPVVSKQSGCFAFGKKSKSMSTEEIPLSSLQKNSLTDQVSDVIKSVAENSKPNLCSENPQMIENIYNHIFKQANGSQKNSHQTLPATTLITGDLRNLALPDVPLHLHRQQLVLQSEQSHTQSQTSTSSTSNVGTTSPSNVTSAYNAQLSKLSEAQFSTLGSRLRQPEEHRQLHQQNQTSFLSQNNVDMEEHQEILASARSPESQTSHASDDHSCSPAARFYNHTRQPQQPEPFM